MHAFRASRRAVAHRCCAYPWRWWRSGLRGGGQGTEISGFSWDGKVSA